MSGLPLANCGIWSDAARELLCQIFHFQIVINIKPDTTIRVCVWGGGGVQMFHFQVVTLSIFLQVQMSFNI